MKNDKLNRIKETLGLPVTDTKIVYPKEFLNRLDSLVDKLDKTNTDKLDTYLSKIGDSFDTFAKRLVDVQDRVVKLEVDNQRSKQVEVVNFPEQKEVIIPKPKDIKIPEYPKTISVKKPSWYEKFIPDKILNAISKGFKQSSVDFANELDKHEEIENAFAVKLVDMKGQTFYNAMMSAFSSGGGNSIISNFPVDYPDTGATTLLTNLLLEIQVQNGGTAMQVDDAGGGVTYQGWAVAGTGTATAGWRIRRITQTVNDYIIDWQDGNANFDNKWTERITAANYS